MIEVLSKPADQIGIRDIESLITFKVPEGEQIESKGSLPAKGQTRDPWENGGDQIGDRAKDKILEEVRVFWKGRLAEEFQKPQIAAFRKNENGVSTQSRNVPFGLISQEAGGGVRGGRSGRGQGWSGAGLKRGHYSFGLTGAAARLAWPLRL